MRRGSRHRARRILRSLPGLVLLGAVPTLLIRGVGSPVAFGQADEVRRGYDLYVAGCSTCHGTSGRGTSQGPPLVGVGAAAVDFMLSTGRMPLADPGQQPARRPPAFDRGEIDAIVAYVGSLGPGGLPIPAVDPALGTVARGRELYASNCLACHGAGAQGASVGGGAVAPPLGRATPTEIAEAVRIGPGVMPPFGEPQIADQDLDSLVRYVIALRSGQDRGGFGLGHVGPVAEGFVAVVVGLGLLVLVARWIGTRV